MPTMAQKKFMSLSQKLIELKLMRTHTQARELHSMPNRMLSQHNRNGIQTESPRKCILWSQKLISMLSTWSLHSLKEEPLSTHSKRTTWFRLKINGALTLNQRRFTLFRPRMPEATQLSMTRKTDSGDKQLSSLNSKTTILFNGRQTTDQKKFMSLFQNHTEHLQTLQH